MGKNKKSSISEWAQQLKLNKEAIKAKKITEKILKHAKPATAKIKNITEKDMFIKGVNTPQIMLLSYLEKNLKNIPKCPKCGHSTLQTSGSCKTCLVCGETSGGCG